MEEVKVKKKLKLKKGPLLVFILLLLGITLMIMPYFLINIHLYGNYEMILDYDEKYSEPGYKGSFLNNDITNKIEVKNNIKNDIGTYYVKYKYKLWFYTKTIKRIVKISDLSGPKITLDGGENYEVTINTEYKEPGFVAIDNKDGDVTDKVKVKNNIDEKTLGDYIVSYEVEDSAHNKTIVERKVKVERLRPTQMSIKDYSLVGWYPDAYLEETKDMGDDYFNSFKIIGDSNIMNFYLSGYLKGINAWAVPCLHAESMFTKDINIYGLGIKIKLLDAIEKYKPERVILDFGSFSTNWIKEEVFLKNANEIIKQIKEKSPKTQIVLMSIYPIANVKTVDNFSQDKINKYNFYILEIAHNHGLKFLDVQSVLKGSNGYANSKYILPDGFHLTNTGHSLVKKYIKTHAI